MAFAKKQQSWLTRFGITLCGVSLVLSFFGFIAGMRWFGYGLWPQSESVLVVLHTCAFLSTIGLIMMGFNRKILGMVMSSAICVIPLLIALWSLFCLLFIDIPMRSFLGSVRIGEGVVWWFNISMMSMSIAILWRFMLWRRIIAISAILSFLTCYSLSVSHYYFDHYYAPLFYPDYLAFAVLCFVPFLFKYIQNHFQFIVFYTLFFFLIFLTDNKSMIGFTVLIPPILYVFMHLAIFPKKTRSIMAYMAITATPFAFIAIFSLVLYLYNDQGIYAFYAMGEVIKSFASRAFLADLSYQSMIANPFSFLIGTGWGHFVDHMAAYQPADWINFTWAAGQWDGLSRDHFHSHNIFVETLNAIGLPGLILLIAYITAFAILAKKQYKIGGIIAASGMMFYGSFWFFMPVLVPFLVLASVTTKQSPLLPQIFKNKAVVSALPFALALIALMQIGAATAIYLTAKQMDDLDPDPLSITNPDNVTCSLSYHDFGAGGVHLNRILLDRVRYTIDLTQTSPNDRPDKESPEKIPGHILAINHLFCQSQLYLQTYPAHIRLQLTAITIRGEMLLGLGGYMDAPTQAYYYRGWRESLLRWIDDHPNRIDLTSTYLLYNLMNGRESESRPVIEAIKRHNPDHPLYLWFEGLTLLSSKTTTLDGLRMMKTALDGGIERFIIVDEETRNALAYLQ